MTTLDALLRAIVADPQNEDRYLVLADYLEEHDDPRRATLLRLHRRLLATCCEPERYPERADWQARIVTMLAEGVRPCVPQRTVRLRDDLDMTLNFVPPGTFLMGSPKGEEGWSPEEVLHRVTLTRGFWMGVFPVTQAQWRAVMGDNPSKFKGDDRPVEMVSWDDYVAFCGRLGEGFCLPSEAQWEYACRAGTTSPFHFGETISTDQANYFGWSIYGKGQAGLFREKTTPVGSFPPNAWGLYDMHGNVWELAAVSNGDYSSTEVVDLRAAPGGAARLIRGGAWDTLPRKCRSAQRLLVWQEYCYNSIGFRVVLCPDE